MKLLSTLSSRMWASLAALSLCWMITGCRSPNDTSTPDTLTPASYIAGIRLTGNVIGSTLIIDEIMSFEVTGENKRLQFSVKPGSHHVRVEKAGKTVVEQTLSIGKGEIKELAVP